MFRKAFTLMEVIVTLAIIAVLAGVIIPHTLTIETNAKESIVETYNNERKIVRLYNGQEISEEESKNYKLVNVDVKDDVIIMYFE